MEQADSGIDIVEELRNWAFVVDKSQSVALVMILSGDVFADAANEIERLRAIVEDLGGSWAE